MSAARGPRWPLVIAATGALVLLTGVGRLAWVWARQDAATADPEASVLGVVLAAAGALVALVGWAVRHHQKEALPATAQQVDESAATLRGMVGEQWDREAAARGLADPGPMPVRWRLTGRTLMDHHSAISPDAPLTFAGSSSRIDHLAGEFRRLPRRRLVITGGPGSGKTTLAVQLLRELLAHPEPGDRVPVLFSLATWDPEVRPQVQGWLAAQLNEMYPSLRAISRNAAAALADQDRILPVLDGLDEVPADRRGAILTALNLYLHGLILTTRRDEYREAIDGAGTALTGAARIAPMALTPDEAARYLARSPLVGESPGWETVLAALRAGEARTLATVTAVPLGLWLVRVVYLTGPVPARPDPSRLTDAAFSTSTELQDHLLKELVPAAVRAHPAPDGRRRAGAVGRRHDPREVGRWLTTLAVQLRDTPDWRWWDMADHSFSTRSGRLAERVLVGLVGGLVFGAIGGVVLGWRDALLIGSAGALAFGLLSRSLTRPLQTQPESPDTDVAERRRAVLRTAVVGLGVGAAVGLVSGFAFWRLFGWAVLSAVQVAGGLPERLGAGVAFGLVAGLAVGLAVALRPFLGPTPPTDGARPAGSTRIRAVARSAGAGLPVVLALVVASGRVTAFVTGLWVGVLVGMLYGLWVGLPTRLRTVVPSVVVLGLMFGFVGGPVDGLAITLPFLVVLAVKRLVAEPALAGDASSTPLGHRGDVARRTTATLTVMVAGGFAFGLLVGPEAGVLFAVALGLTFGSTGLARGLSIGAVVGLCVGLSSVLWVALLAGEANRAATGIRVGVELGVAFGIVFGLRIFFGRPTPSGGAASPRISFRKNVAHGLTVDLVLLLVTSVGLTAVVLAGGSLSDVPRLAIMAGLLGVVTGALTQAWFGFMIAASWEYLRGRRLPAPWRVMAVLDDCYRLGLLRTVGPVYQFRHRRLQVYLARARPEPPSVGSSPTGPPLRVQR